MTATPCCLLQISWLDDLISALASDVHPSQSAKPGEEKMQ